MTIQEFNDWVEEQGLDLETEIVFTDFSGTGDLERENLIVDHDGTLVIDTTA